VNNQANRREQTEGEIREEIKEASPRCSLVRRRSQMRFILGDLFPAVETKEVTGTHDAFRGEKLVWYYYYCCRPVTVAIEKRLCSGVPPLANDVGVKNTLTVKITRYPFGLVYSGARGCSCTVFCTYTVCDVASNVARKRRRR
jgi:hypothetical protein